MPSAKPITGSQVRHIHTLLTRRGIEDGVYRKMLDSHFGVTTCKDLTRREAHQLLNRLGAGKLAKPGARAKPKQKKPRPAPLPPGVTALATPEQRRLIEALVSEVAWRIEGGYGRWLSVNMHLPQVRTRAEAARVIEGLKAMKRRQQRAAVGE